MNGTIINIQNLSKSYKIKREQQQIIKNINLNIKNKEFICILGPSGCGKSTLLKIIGGIQTPSTGKITLGGETFEKGIPSSALNKFGFVFQNHNLLPWRTAENNLSLMLEVFRLKGPTWTKRVSQMLETV